MTGADADARRAEMLDSWEAAAGGWGRRADDLQRLAMPVSEWMIDHLQLHPGQRVLELAAGPGDVGFLAAELLRPGGWLICSDGAEAMVEIARRRGREMGIDNAEFRRLELEWIDLPTADVDALLCRWGLMLVVDPPAAAREMRRVLRPGGRASIAVWDSVAENPWATVLSRAPVELGYADPPDPSAPHPFALGDAGQLRELLVEAGFSEVVVEPVELSRRYPSVREYVMRSLDHSMVLKRTWRRLEEPQREALVARVAELATPFTEADGAVELPGRALCAAAEA